MNFNDFYFIRPLWLISLLPIAFVLFRFYKKKYSDKIWLSVVESHLFNALKIDPNKTASKTKIILIAICAIIMILALSGPSFYKYPHSTFKINKTYMLILDLSISMNATDSKPTRLKRAVLAINNFLNKTNEGEFMLMGFAGEPYLISPATADKKTILSLIDGITTNIIPTQGSRLDLAFTYAKDLLADKKNSHNSILLLTDAEKISSSAFNIAKEINKNDTKISVIGFGSKSGTPIQTDNGFLKINENIIISKQDETLLKSLAKSGGGIYLNSQTKPKAIDDYINFNKNTLTKKIEKMKDKNIELYRDDGIWLVLLLLPLVALTFRKGFSFIILIPLLIPTNSEASWWQDLWQTQNQQAQKAYNDKDFKTAAQKFENESWKATSLYRAKKFEAAVANYSDLKQYYNQGNSLANLNKLNEAIKVYEKVDKDNDNYENAQYNINAIKEFLKKKKNKNQKNKNQKSKTSNSNQNQQNSQKQDNKNQQDNKQNNKNSKNGDKKQQKKKNKLTDEEKKRLAKEGQKKAKEKKENKADNKKSEAKKKNNKNKENKKITEKKENESGAGKKLEKKEKKPKRSALETLNNEKKQLVEQYLKKIKTKPYGLLQRKFLIEREYRKQNKSKIYNPTSEITW